MPFVVALVALLIAAAAASPAAAGPERVTAASNLAQQTWGSVCQGEIVPVVRGDITGLAYAEYRYAADEQDNRHTYFDCRITFRRGHIPWRKFCTATIHEFGHLAAWRAKPGDEYVSSLGHVDTKHSANRRRVMFPRYVRTHKRCRKPPRTGAAFDEAPGLPPPASPTVLLLHGGGWLSGDPSSMRRRVNEFMARGVRARAIRYPFGSVIRAINHVKKVAAQERGPVILYGLSAGGTIAAALAASGDVDGAINVVGPTDFTTWVTPVGLALQARLRMTRAEQLAASPLHRLRGRQTPQLIQCGIADPITTYDQCLRYASAAHRGQPDTTLKPLLNGHGQWPADRRWAIRWVQTRWPSPPGRLVRTHSYRERR